MKENVLVITNFSPASQNALSYACQLLDGKRYEVLLVHIYTLPVTYTVEGIALASVSESFQEIELQLNANVEWVQQQFPELNISARYVMGGLVESLRQLIAEQEPELVLFGTTGYYSELWHTDSELLLTLRNLTVPVMIIPQHIAFQPLQRIGFACDYRSICIPKQVDFIRRLVHQTGADLYVVHVTRSMPDTELMKKNETLLQEALSEVRPHYHAVNSSKVFEAIDDFVVENNLDLLMVIPRKHEFWSGLFHKNNIDQLAFLNRLPLLALPE